MRIAIHIAALKSPLTGIGNYTLEITRQLLCVTDQIQIFGFNAGRIYASEELSAHIQQLEQECRVNTPMPTTINARIKNSLKIIPGMRRTKENVDYLFRAQELHRLNPTLYWEPNYILPPHITIPAITTLHDLSHLRYPQYHPVQRVKKLTQQLPESIQRAQAIVTVSEFSRQEIITLLGVQPEKITIVAPGVNDIFRRQPSPEYLQRFKTKQQLPDKFILSVGTLEPRKNVMGLLQAFKSLPDALRKRYPLVLAGDSGWLNQKEKITPYLQNAEIIRLGYVDRLDLPDLYAAASLFIYPSFYEGYGMPIAEAMASGVPVITSGVSSMPEVAGGSARLINPHDIDELTGAMTELLQDPQQRQHMIDTGRRVSSAYTWQKSAQHLRNLFLKIHSYKNS
jgi:alpha-1,3-rhamnosyl/mannosyltransferase